MSYFKPISISLSPNIEKDDVLLALKLIFRPWKWKRGEDIEKLEKEFKKYFGVEYAISYNSGRSAFFAILKALNLKENKDEVLVQAFTCNALPNPILWAKLKPVYVDCNENDFNISLEDAKKKNTNNSKVLVVQHTFGIPAQLNEILKFCEDNDLILIEDCAHSLGARYHGKKIGTFGKAAFFSFSRDKVISSVYGGMAITNDPELGKKLKELQKEFNYPSNFWILQQLLHPILLHFLILPLYNFFDLGKIFLILSQYFHILSKAVHWKEKKGLIPPYFPKALPNALACLALHQFKKIDRFFNHREKISNYYYKSLKNTSFFLPPLKEDSVPSYLRFTVKHKKAHEIIYDAWHKENILLGDWYTSPIAPYDTDLEKLHYQLESCPTAEKLSKISLNLPTHINITFKDAERIICFLKKYDKQN